MQKPEWIITDENGEGEQIEFKDIFSIKNKVKTLTLLWPMNSYYVNVEDKYFIIHGGKRIQTPGLADLTDTKLLYAKRNRQDFTLNGDRKGKEVTYLLGIEGKLEGSDHVIFLEVSSGGELWRWKFER